jgi:hypothetical protein
MTDKEPSLTGNQILDIGSLIRDLRESGNEGLFGQNLLHVAATRGYDRLIAPIVARWPGMLDEEDIHGSTPLHCAATYGRRKCLVGLLNAGANVVARDFDDMTPLHRAAAEGQVPCVHSLLTRGADLEATDRWGKTPLDWAERERCIRLLHGDPLSRTEDAVDDEDAGEETPLAPPLILRQGSFAFATGLSQAILQPAPGPCAPQRCVSKVVPPLLPFYGQPGREAGAFVSGS